jgi:ADP-ribose pyrophosphatase
MDRYEILSSGQGTRNHPESRDPGGVPPFPTSPKDDMTRQVVFRGRKIEVALDTTVMPNGRTVQRDVVLHPGAVAILPMVDADHICLLRNNRPIVGERLLEIPAGTLEPGEVPDKAAVRELLEETGYQAARWRKLAAFYPSPGVLSERTHLYLAEELTPGPSDLEDDEDLHAEVVSWPQAVAWALDGTIRDAKTLVGILLWDRLRQG